MLDKLILFKRPGYKITRYFTAVFVIRQKAHHLQNLLEAEHADKAGLFSYQTCSAVTPYTTISTVNDGETVIHGRDGRVSNEM